MWPVDSVRLNSVLEFGVLSQIFPKLIAELLQGSADVILPPGFATCKCGTDVLCPFQLQAPRKPTRTRAWGIFRSEQFSPASPGLAFAITPRDTDSGKMHFCPGAKPRYEYEIINATSMTGVTCSTSADMTSPAFASINSHFKSTRSTFPSTIISLLLAVHCAKSRAVLMFGGAGTHAHPNVAAELIVRARMADTRRWKCTSPPQILSLPRKRSKVEISKLQIQSFRLRFIHVIWY
jgi:hypothetical protein